MLSQPALRVPALFLVTAQDPRELTCSWWSRCAGWPYTGGCGGLHEGIQPRILQLIKLSRFLLNLLIVGYGQVMGLKSICTHINMHFFNRTSPMKTMSHSLEMTWSLDFFDIKVSKVLTVVLGQSRFISRRLDRSKVSKFWEQSFNILTLFLSSSFPFSLLMIKIQF